MSLAMDPEDHFVRPAEPNELVPENYFAEIDPPAFFGREAPLEVDLGCGDGRFTLEMAERYPERNFLAVERLLGRVRKVCRGAGKRGLENVRVLRLETLYTLEWLFPEDCVDRLHLLCPDPWPKAKHHRRRLLQEPFLKAALRVLKPGGELLFKTDHDEYFDWSEEQLEAFPQLEKQPWEDEDFFYPKTDFQLQWEREGKRLQKLRARKPR
jgi:tRNA (guanine-N7-)-methyltransferase